MSKSQRSAGPRLSRREREIMDVLYRLGRASVAEVHAGIPEPPSKTAIRSLLWLLEEKGHVRHEQQGPHNVYEPIISPTVARSSALGHLLDTFFGGSRGKAALAILGEGGADLDDHDIERLETLLARHKRERKKR